MAENEKNITNQPARSGAENTPRRRSVRRTQDGAAQANQTNGKTNTNHKTRAPRNASGPKNQTADEQKAARPQRRVNRSPAQTASAAAANAASAPAGEEKTRTAPRPQRRLRYADQRGENHHAQKQGSRQHTAASAAKIIPNEWHHYYQAKEAVDYRGDACQ